MRGVAIRLAVASDAEALARMAEALSRSQEEPEHRLTAAVLRDHAFGPDPAFECIVAERDGAAVGYASFVDAYESSAAARGFYLCDLFVTEAARRQGIGRTLVAAVSAEARRRGRSYVWWASKPWNEAAHAFYRTLGATHEPVVAHALFGETFERLADISLPAGEGSRVGHAAQRHPHSPSG
jgi:GNAT superfamily N-acetyltransferase